MAKPFLRLSNVIHMPAHLQNGVVAIGNFDGVHRGHQSVLEQALVEAEKRQCPASVLTFEPHPRSFFKPDHPVDRLTNADEKAEILHLMGFDAVVEQPFDAAFSGLTAEDFVRSILLDAFKTQAVVTGYDFHFGQKRLGTPDFLKAQGRELGFDVIQITPFKDEGGVVVSSSRVRTLLKDGKVEEAAALLGYRYTVSGPIIHGQKLGRTLGFPTTNMQLPTETHLSHGIYAVRLRRIDGSLYNGVASFGRRPTVTDEGRPLLETFIFDFDDNLYDEYVQVSFFSRLRGEEKFDGLEALTRQMQKDEAEARAILQNVQPLSTLDRHFTFS